MWLDARRMAPPAGTPAHATKLLDKFRGPYRIVKHFENQVSVICPISESEEETDPLQYDALAEDIGAMARVYEQHLPGVSSDLPANAQVVGCGRLKLQQ